MQDISREAKFFRGADHVFVWTSFHEELSSRAPKGVWNIAMSLRYRLKHTSKSLEIQDMPWSIAMGFRLMDLCEDPYFTSLWRLEEAYLGENAVSLSRSGGIAQIEHFEEL